MIAAPPQISHPSDNQVFLMTRGDSRSIPCQAQGRPYPTVTWLNTNMEQTHTGGSASGPNLTFSDLPVVMATLRLQNVVEQLTANFTCRAFSQNPLNLENMNQQKMEAAVVIVKGETVSWYSQNDNICTHRLKSLTKSSIWSPRSVSVTLKYSG